MTVFGRLLETRKRRGAALWALLDPDRTPGENILDLALSCERSDVDALLVGSSLLLSSRFEEALKLIKGKVSLPVVIFPGNANQISRYADAILYLSLISGRNPDLLIGEQMKAAPLIREYGIEPISTGYMIVDSGGPTSVQFMSNTQPLPQDRPDIAKAHALAAQYLGMKMLYLEAGSGAKNSVPERIIEEVRGYVDLPLIVGGGIRTPEEAAQKVEAGADFVVVGNTFEETAGQERIEAFSQAVHQAGEKRIAKLSISKERGRPTN